MTRWITAIAAAVVLTAVSSWAWAQNDLLREPVEFSDISFRDVPEPNRPYELFANAGHAVRRGWFLGKKDGTFDPDNRITNEQMVQVINRAFPNGMQRIEFANLLVEGENAAGLRPGTYPNNPIPKGQLWQVGEWDIRVLNAWTGNGYEELRRRGYNLPEPKEWERISLVDIEVVYRGPTTGAPSFNLKSYPIVHEGWLPLGVKDFCGEDGPVADGHIRNAAAGARPGVPIRGWLCWRMGDESFWAPGSDEFYDRFYTPGGLHLQTSWPHQAGNNAEFELLPAVSSWRGAHNDLLQEPVEFSDVSFPLISGNPNLPLKLFANAGHAVRRGWFLGKKDGTFDPDNRITNEQMTRVIDRAFPDGLQRIEFANLLVEGENGAGLRPGTYANHIPKGQFWQVGEWDVRVLNAWTGNGYEELHRRGYNLPEPKEWERISLVDIEVVYRGPTIGAPSFNPRADSFDLKASPLVHEGGLPLGVKDFCGEDGPVADGHINNAAAGARPGVPIRGWLCWRMGDESFWNSWSNEFYDRFYIPISGLYLRTSWPHATGNSATFDLTP